MDAQGPDAAADAGSGALALGLGELHDAPESASGIREVTLATPAGDEEFLVLVQSRATPTARIEAFGFTVTPGAAAQRAPAPPLPAVGSRPAGAHPAPPRADRVSLRCGFDQRALADLRERLAGQPVPRGVLPPPPPGPPPLPGDTLTFEIDGAGGLVTVDASVLHVSASLVVCLDKTTDPDLTLDAALLQEIADGFETIALPRLRDAFGTESDVNGDGHVTVLFSPLVADLATAYVNPYDLVTDPALRPGGVAANDQELIYVTPPQLLEPQMGTSRAIIETVSHEFQHAIYFYRKYLLHDQLGGQESVYLTEGLSGLAQDLSGYQAGLFFINKTALDQWDLISVNDLVRSAGGYFQGREQLYGGAYLLLRYLFDQAGGEALLPSGMLDVAGSPGVAWLRAFVDSPEVGVTSLEAAAGQPVADLATDWYTALMVDDRVDDGLAPLNTDARFNFLPPTTDPLTGRQRGTTMFESFMGMVHKTGPVLREAAEADGAIRVGGAEYLHVAAAAPGTLTVRVVADPVEVEALVRIFRIR